MPVKELKLNRDALVAALLCAGAALLAGCGIVVVLELISR